MSTARAELVGELESLRGRLGSPSLRSIAAGSGCSHTTVAKLLSSDQPLPSWPRVESVATHLQGNVNHIRHMWLAARREAGAGEDAVSVSLATDTSRRYFSYYAGLYALTSCMVVAVTVGGAVERTTGWLLSVTVQIVMSLGAAVLAIALRGRYHPDVRTPMAWFAASATCTVVAEVLQILAPHISNPTPATILSDGLYLTDRAMLIVCLATYLRNRSHAAITPWIKMGLAWTPLIWACATSVCFVIMSEHITAFGRVAVVQLLVNAFYLTLDIQLAVVASVVVVKYAPKRGPFFLVMLIGTFLLVSDTAWNLLGPTAGPTPFTVGIGYVATSALMVAIAMSPDLRSSPTPPLRGRTPEPAPDRV